MPQRLFRGAVVALLTALPATALAQTATPPNGPTHTSTAEGLNKAAGEAGFTLAQTSVLLIISNVVNAVLAASGILFMCLLVYGGVVYLTAGGDETKVKSAKGSISSAVIGLVIVLTSYALARFVFVQLGGVLSSPASPAP